MRFTVSSDLRPPDACHCVQCRKHSGHCSPTSTHLEKHIFVAEKGDDDAIGEGLPQNAR